jgi:uncharacterized membrane protein YphA (DoxX/SURF4 family)
VNALSPGAALLPLRLFLGATFVYAGVHKLTDAGFLRAGSDTYIGDQLEAFAEGTPGGPLLEAFALPQPELAGIGVALSEIAIGLLAVAGRFTRASAAAGLALSLVLFLTASGTRVRTSSGPTSCSRSRGCRSCWPARRASRRSTTAARGRCACAAGAACSCRQRASC